MSKESPHCFPLQESEADIRSVVSSINDVFDGTNDEYKVQIASMNDEGNLMYRDLSQGLQVK